MSDICEKCLKYEIALTRIAKGRDDGSLNSFDMQCLAAEALSTDQPLSDAERKLLQEYVDWAHSISPHP